MLGAVSTEPTGYLGIHFMIIPLVVLTCKYEMFQECKNVLLKVLATFIEPPFVPGTEVAEMKDILADPDVMGQS